MARQEREGKQAAGRKDQEEDTLCGVVMEGLCEVWVKMVVVVCLLLEKACIIKRRHGFQNCCSTHH